MKANLFLDLCNHLNDLLVEKYRLSKHTTLGQAIRQTRYLDPVIKRFYDLLIDISELRNVLVHNTQHQTYLAEPNDVVMKTLEHVIIHIKKPKRLKDYTYSKAYTLDLNMSLKDVLHVIKEKRYSHYPVYDNTEFKGILTDNGITHYLADHMDTLLDYDDIKVSDILECDDHSDAYVFFEMHTLVLDLMDKIEPITKTKVILLVNQKEHTSKNDLIGLLLPKDILSMFEDMMKVGKPHDKN